MAENKINLTEALSKALAKSNGETIRKHTDKLKERKKGLKKNYQDQIQKLCPEKYKNSFWNILDIVIEYHDYGKLHSSFQKKLLKNGKQQPYELIDAPEIPHNFLSLCFLTDDKFANLGENAEDIKKVVFQAIAYHHDKRDIDERLYQKIIEEVAPKDLQRFQENLNLKFWSYVDPKNYLKPNGNELFKLLVLVKGLLHRCDYTASGDVEIEIKPNDFKVKIDEIFKQKNFNYNSFQQCVNENKDKNLILIAATGGGKTEAGGLYIGNNKGFFILPLRASINAIYDRFTGTPNGNELKYNYSNVGLLHSTALFRLMESKLGDENRYKDDSNIEFTDIFSMYEEAKNLSNQIIISTPDQLFPFVFKYPGFERIYATLGYSKVVLDEIQMYNPRMLAFIVKGLQVIKELGGKVLVMTATFPEFLKEYFNDFEIESFSDESCKHNIQLIGNTILTLASKIKENGNNKKVLVICNTIKRAIEVFEELTKQEANIKGLFHSRFIQKHRNILEEEIKKFAPNRKQEQSNNEPGIWITTQVAEVSLDIDFDILYTELSTIDSLIQRMGRVNRSGKNKETPNVIICTEDCSGIRKIYDQDIFDKTKEALKQNSSFSFDFSESDKMEMVKEIFKKENLENSNYLKEFEKSIKIIEEIWNVGKLYNPIETLKEAQQQFREIVNITAIPKGVYEANKDTIDDLVTKIKNNDNWEEKYKSLKALMDYTLSIPYWYAKQKWELFRDIWVIEDCEYNFDEIQKRGKGYEVNKVREDNLID